MRPSSLISMPLGRPPSLPGTRDQPFCVALLDLDHFKALNDAHGHAAAGKLLTRLQGNPDFRTGCDNHRLRIRRITQHIGAARSPVGFSVIFPNEGQFLTRQGQHGRAVGVGQRRFRLLDGPLRLQLGEGEIAHFVFEAGDLICRPRPTGPGTPPPGRD